MIGLIMVGSCINFLTRSTLGVAAPTMLHDLHMTAQQYSYVLSGFQLSLMVQPLAGFIMDVIGLKLGFALFAVLWSLLTMSHGLVGSWQGLFAVRTLLGLPEGAANPAGVKATAEWFPARERGLAGGVYNIGASFGAMVAPPLVIWAILFYNWEFAFVVTGAIGLVWAGLYLAFYNSPEKHKWLSPEEKKYILDGQEKYVQAEHKAPSIPQILRNRNFWGIAFPRFLADPTWSTLSFWVPLYLITVRHMDLKQIALFAWMPFLAADAGCIFGGMLAGWLLKHTAISTVNARRCVFTVGATLMLGMPFVGYVDNPYTAIALLCLGGFAHQTLSVTVITMASDLFRRNEVATAAGCAGTLSGVGNLIFQLAIGSLVASIGYAPFFVMLAVFDLIGAIVLWTVVKDPAGRQGVAVLEPRPV
jgi:ACS family hexuronate transporter-like MFS transporter